MLHLVGSYQPVLRFTGASRKAKEPTIPQRIAEIVHKNPKLAQYAAVPIKEWVDQFETRKEKLQALRLLENIHYYDMADVRQGAQELHQWLIKQPGFDMEKTKFTHFAIGKSGGLVQYFYRAMNRLPNQLGIEFSQIGTPTRVNPKKDVDTLVILDDFMGTAREADYFFTKMAKELKRYKKVYLLTLVGFKEGDQLLKDYYPNVTFHAWQMHDKILDPGNSQFTAREKQDLYTLMNKYGEKTYPKSKYGPTASGLGYRDGQSLVVFFYNTPSNTPPIFWSAENSWKPLYPRFDSFNVPFYPPKYVSQKKS